MREQSRVFHRQLNQPLPRAVSGQGVYLIDSKGKRYLDASGGAAVSCLGHGDADVINAIKEQLETLAFAHTGFFTSRPAEELAELLIRQYISCLVVRRQLKQRLRWHASISLKLGSPVALSSLHVAKVTMATR